MIDDFINKMAQNDPTKYHQIAKEFTQCDYMKWQAFRMRDYAIEKSQLDNSNDDTSDSNSKVMSKEEFEEFVKNGGFDNN